jgi:hypothetical protein
MSRQRSQGKFVFTGPSKEYTLQFNGGDPLGVSQLFCQTLVFIDIASLRVTIEEKDVGNDLKTIATPYLKTLEGLSAEINTILHDAAPTEAKKASLAEEAFQELNLWLQGFTNDDIVNQIPYCEGEFKITLECIHKSFQLIACAVHCLLALLATLIMQQKFDQEVLVSLASKKRFKRKELTDLLQHAKCITSQGVNDAKKSTLILSEGSSELGIIDTAGAKVPLSKYLKFTEQWIQRHCTPCPDELDQNLKLMKTISKTFQHELNQALAKQEELVETISKYIHNTRVETADDDDSGNNSRNNSKKTRKHKRLEGAGKGPEHPAPPNENTNAGGSSKKARPPVVYVVLD